MNTWKSIILALVAGVGIGLLAAVLTAQQRAESRSSEEQTQSVAESADGGESEDETEEYDAEQAAEEYKEYLEEAAEDKNVQAEELDLLNIAEDAYLYLVNAMYPENDYDKNGFRDLENGQREYTDTEAYTSRSGIDVSEFNGEIDWEQVKAAGYEFAFVRVGYRGYESGDIFRDALFEENLRGAQEAGLDTGVYFFSQAADEEEAIEEARFVIRTLDGADLQLPVFFDPESISFDYARTDQITGTQFTKNTLAFCSEIEAAGYDAGYYCNYKWEVFMLDMAALKEYTVWYAGYEPSPRTPYEFTFWQYTDEGEVPGISESVDLDIQLIPVS